MPPAVSKILRHSLLPKLELTAQQHLGCFKNRRTLAHNTGMRHIHLRMRDLCEACSQLGLKPSDFTSPPFEPERRYLADIRSSTVGELRESAKVCSVCELILDALKRTNATKLVKAGEDAAWTLQWAQSTDDYQPTRESQRLYGSALHPVLGPAFENYHRGYRIQVVDERDTAGFLRGRLYADEIDTQMLKGWLKQCQEEHGEDCSRSDLHSRRLSAATMSRLIVIDVEDLCIRELPDDSSYVALSYVWGENNEPRNRTANRAALSTIHGLKITLPQTIQDAVELVRTLGFTFLWVASLCIPQDIPSIKQLYIDNMNAIYASAKFTIVAATGDGAHSGLSGVSDKAYREQHNVTLDNGLRLGVLPEYQRELLDCHHSQRAWTYQETCLSPRCLIFLNGFAYFNCNAAVFSEHTKAEFPGLLPEASANTLGKRSDENALRRYSAHVRAYMSRSLSYQSDGLNAFTGVANALSNVMGARRMLYGMPISCFDWALLWTGHASLRRREGFPSWSWVGWEGNISMSQDTYGSYDQSWLLQATWIDWYSCGQQGQFTPLWDSKDVGNTVSSEIDSRSHSDDQGSMVDTDEDSDGDNKVENVHGEHDEGETDDGTDTEDEPCPTYGHSCPANPFGRQVHRKAMDLLGERPSDSAGYGCRPTGTSPPELLYFYAPTLRVQAGPLETTLGHLHPPASPILDKHGRKCGFLSICNHELWHSAGTRAIKLVAVSGTSYGDLTLHHGAGHTSALDDRYGLDEKALDTYLGSLPDEVDNFDFVNVLLIQETHRQVEVVTSDGLEILSIYERAGLGFVHRTALRHLDTVQWCDIALG